ncbi:37S ribosomal protein S22 [Borealophlyctis nickersoniae]|nr:37S ribosomal protein S22 [Borealophlyctis nickersoniae]
MTTVRKQSSIRVSPGKARRLTPEMLYADNRIGQLASPVDLVAATATLLKARGRKKEIKIDSARILESLRSTGLASKLIKKNPDGTTGPLIEPHVLEYGEREAYAYLASRVPITYAATQNVFMQIAKRIPDFAPTTMLDFGTGPGTGIWAAYVEWGESLKQSYGVDISEAMLDLAEALAGYENSPIKGFEPQRYLSYRHAGDKRDLVTSLFTLSDLPSDAIRQSTVETLWNQTGDVLVIIERGNPAGFQAVAAARQQILDLEEKKQAEELEQKRTDGEEAGAGVEEKKGVHIVAPRNARGLKRNSEDSKFAFVVLRRGPRPIKTKLELDAEKLATAPNVAENEKGEEKTSPKVAEIEKEKEKTREKRIVHQGEDVEGDKSAARDILREAYNWPRLVMPPLKRGGHVIIDVCGSGGNMERSIVRKAHGAQLYYEARKVHWGDQWPHAFKGEVYIRDVEPPAGASDIVSDGEFSDGISDSDSDSDSDSESGSDSDSDGEKRRT